MNRILSEQDFQELSAAEIEMTNAGWDFVTKEGGTKNAQLLLDYLEKNPQIPCTRAELYRFLQENQSLFVARTPMQRKWDAAVKAFGRSQEELNQFQQLLATVGASSRVDVSGDNLYYNGAILLAQLQGRAIDHANFVAAIGRLAPNSFGSKYGPTEHLHFVAERVPVDPRKGLHAADENYRPGRFIEEFNQTDGTRFRGHTEEQPATTPQVQREQTYWSKANDALCSNGSWGQREAMKEVRAKELAKHGSEMKANRPLQEAYRAIFKTSPVPVTPFEAIAGMVKRP
jgi:hypothetical protein